ncbi:MAG TPA: inorganic phosphate transporter [Clostridia bacterium]
MLNGMAIAVIVVILLGLSFDFINGFHDTANSIATAVSTRVVSPKVAIMGAAVLNIIGALTSQQVAATISQGILQDKYMPDKMGVLCIVISALVAAIIWNLVTWYLGMPSSSSHALFGGLIGSAAAYVGSFSVLKWYEPHGNHFYEAKGILMKILVPLFSSPVIGFFLGFLVMRFLYYILRNRSFNFVNRYFSKLQIVSAALMAFAHGGNDAQKSMGIITIALMAVGWNEGKTSPIFPVVLACAIAMGLGTSVGGWKIIKTIGVNMIKLQPVHGFAAETGAAAVIETMTRLGAPVSTTHIITTSIMGVGASKRLSAVKWSLARDILWAWLLTIPVTAFIGALVAVLLKLVIFR